MGHRIGWMGREGVGRGLSPPHGWDSRPSLAHTVIVMGRCVWVQGCRVGAGGLGAAVGREIGQLMWDQVG